MILLPPETPVLELLSFDPRWQVLYRDKQAALLARDVGAGAAGLR